MRAVAQQAQLSCAYLPLILSGKRKLSSKSLEKLSPHLALTKPEQDYLELLRALSDSESQEKKLDTLKKMQTIRQYRQLNPNETEAYRYLTDWYYVAIREMVSLPDFQPEPKWIADTLKNRISVGQAATALDFLLANGYLKMENGKVVRQTDRRLRCVGGVYSIALNHFHSEILEQGLKELNTPQVQDRHILGYTLSYSKNNLSKINTILQEALEKIAEIEKQEKKPDNVFHVSLFAFPLTTSKRSSQKPGGSNE